MGFAAFGTILSISGTVVAELTGISGPGISADTIDVSHHKSDYRHREFDKGIADGGEVSVEGSLINTGAQVTLLGAMNETDTRPFVITFPTANPKLTWTYYGFVTGFSSDAPFEDKASFSATIKVDGRPILGTTPIPMEAEAPVAGDKITVTFSKAMADPDGKHAEFKFQVNGGADEAFTAAALDADTKKIVLSIAIGDVIKVGEAVTLKYTVGTVVAADTGVLASFTVFPVENNSTA